MKKGLSLIALFTMFSICLSNAQVIEGTLEKISIHSQSISGNIFADDANQYVVVYLPPSYATNTNKKYPVLYFLCGYNTIVELFTEIQYFQFSNFNLKVTMDKLINEGVIKEMIVVIPNSFTFLNGSFFSNSSVNGNYEDFYTQELVDYVNTNYRTIDTRNARGIAGHSMGGSGALDLSMKHPDIYCMGYGLCSGLLAPNWVEESPIFGNETAIRSSINLFNKLGEMSKTEAHTYYTAKIDSLNNNWLAVFGYAYGTAYAGDSSLSAPYFNYPFFIENNNIKVDSTVLADWADGFGNLSDKIINYKNNLLSLKEYVLDYGINDEFTYIVSGNNYYHQLLNAENIPHSFINNGGDHSGKLTQQIETSILPLCSNTLEFDTLNLSSEAAILNFSFFNPKGNIVINSENKTIEVFVSENRNLSNLQPVIQTSVGANINPKSREKVDFSNGPVTYNVVSENGLISEVWTINFNHLPTSVKQIESLNKIIYPNPAWDLLNISPEIKNKITRIDIYNMVGSKIYTSTEGDPIVVSDYPIGIYNVKIQLETGEILNQKIVKE